MGLAASSALSETSPPAAAPDQGARPADPRFSRFDLDGDGRISREEARGTALERMFDRLDRDGDGFLTPDEIPPFDAARRGKGRRAVADLDPSAVRLLDLPYGEIPDGSDPSLRSLDLYAPADADGAPVMVYIHGGGWSRGDKSAVALKPRWFVGRGWILASINYRLVSEVSILEQLQDSAEAIAWLHDRVAEYGGDPEQIHLMGHSAGGHHAALLTTNPEFLEAAGKGLGILRSATAIDTAAFDLPGAMASSPSPIYRDAFGDDPAVWERISPLHHVASDRGIPPFMLLVAKGTPRRDARIEAFREALLAAGVRCELHRAPEHDHGSVNRTLGDPGEATTAAVEAFLDSLRENSHAAELEAGIDVLRRHSQVSAGTSGE